RPSIRPSRRITSTASRSEGQHNDAVRAGRPTSPTSPHTFLSFLSRESGEESSMTLSVAGRAAVVSVVIFIAFVLAWHVATQGTSQVQQMDPEYAKLIGATAHQGKSG